MKNRKIQFIISLLLILSALFILQGCQGKKDVKKEASKITVETPDIPDEKSSPNPSPSITSKPPAVDDEGEDISDDDISVIPKVKTKGFTKKEIAEINRDGYLSYYYRRKYSPIERELSWKAVNKLFPNYTKDEKLHALRSILAYHWVVYKHTPLHRMKSNVAVTRRYEKLIDETAEFHQVPPEMVKGIITWENSGGVSKESWAACVGVGQLSVGAVQTAHEFYGPFVDKMEKTSGTYKFLGSYFDFPMLTVSAADRKRKAELYNVAARHRKLRVSAGIEDERHIPSCNVEDAVIYLKLLYNNYGNRMDLAVSAYHNGGLNNNDIIRDHLNRNHSESLGERAEQTEIISAINKADIKYIDLWRDRVSRDILNGLRTVYGKVTGSHNAHLALGDESDIYPWKVAAALGSLEADSKTLNGLTKKYRGEWDVAETRGLRTYTTYEEISKAIRGKWLVKLPPVYKDSGISDVRNGAPSYYKQRAMYNYYVTGETAGLLLEISKFYQQHTKNPNIKIPIEAALNSRVLERYKGSELSEDALIYLKGVSFDVDMENASNKKVLYAILKNLYLHDHIYFIRSKGKIRITVNPRFGKYYYGIWKKYKDSKRS